VKHEPAFRELFVKVIPKSARNEVVGYMDDGALKVKIAAAPEKGRANDELRRVLAEHFGVAVRDVEIVSGETSQRKRVRIMGLR
jgi:uncharacterized protein (TIGR00251 family)